MTEPRTPRATAQAIIEYDDVLGHLLHVATSDTRALAEAAESMRTALEFYAEACGNNECSTHSTFDGGQRARAALAEYEGTAT